MYNKNSQLKTINEHQIQSYERYEKATSDNLIKQYSFLLEKIKSRNIIKILDIGGASGNFALALCKYFSEISCEVVVVDNTRYRTWTEYADKITFIENSADNLNALFSENTFDLIFANRVFHHFVKGTWNKTIAGINDIMKQIAIILKNDGYFCITDYFYDGRFFDTSSSRIIYTLTSCKMPLFVSLFRKIEAKSAGIGVCFLSKKMWFNMFSKYGFIVETLNVQGNPPAMPGRL
jgi:ubiquinone/menaquinone biosynthesis C-methylase UbiE